MQYFAQWNSDAGHEWLAVRAGDCKELGLKERDFSASSYKGKLGMIWYLEGDSDAVFFIEAVKRKGAELKLAAEYYEAESFIRSLPRLKGESRLFEKRMAERQAAKQAVLPLSEFDKMIDELAADLKSEWERDDSYDHLYGGKV